MKIEEIILNNYRAFCNQRDEDLEKYKISLAGGKNLLIFGENGSGKSSLFKGIFDFFKSATNSALSFPQNIFYDGANLKDRPYVKVIFNNGTALVPYYFSSDTALINTGVDFLKEVGRTRSFMSYRELMKIHFIDQLDVNLFDFLISDGGLLAEIPNQVSSAPDNKLTLSKLWEKLCNGPDDIAIDDFNNSINQQLKDLEVYLNKLLAFFDHKIEPEFEFKEIPKGTTDVNKLGFIGLKVKYQGRDITDYHLFLNEARLTALAISIYLAAHLSVPRGNYEILFLDDVFTGLDTSNRIPLLKILSASTLTGNSDDTFLRHQIFLTTYDRQWFDLAKDYLGFNWKAVELFVGELPDGTISPVLIDPSHNYLQKAKAYFENKDYPACANYQRKECERLIKKFLPDHLKVAPNTDGDIKPINKLGQLFDNLQRYCREHNLNVKTLEDFKNYSKVVMNPLSHDDLLSPAYKRELEAVFEIIKVLEKLKNELKIRVGTIICLEKTRGKTSFSYEFEVLSEVRVLSSEGDRKVTPITVMPLKIRRTRHHEQTFNRISELWQRARRFFKLGNAHTDLDIKKLKLKKAHDFIHKWLGVENITDYMDDCYVVTKGSKRTIKDITT